MRANRMKIPHNAKLLPKGVLLEFIPWGNSMKACALDPVSTLEAVVVGSIHTPRRQIATEAVRKLERIVKQKYADDIRQHLLQMVKKKPKSGNYF